MAANGHSSVLSLPVTVDDHSQGPANAVVTLVEYGDYECPHCGRAYPIVKEAQRRLGVRLRFVFRNFPLTNIHPHAQQAAEAAEAAGAQGLFWEMHDRLFEQQRALNLLHLVEYAREIGADRHRFFNDLTYHAYFQHVRADFLGGIRSGVNGTPTFFINGIRYDGAWDLDSLMERLEAEQLQHVGRVAQGKSAVLGVASSL
jgi:protein-disulfide isomerase